MVAAALTLAPFGLGTQSTLPARLEEILQAPVLQSALAGVCVAKPDGSVLFERNADLRMMPASNQKILSVAFALHGLGPDWKPKTKIWKEPGRLVVDCPGDPSMTYARLQDAAKRLGTPDDWPVYVRQGYRAGVPPTWENDDLPHRYAPRVTALTVDRGSFTLANASGMPVLKPEPYGVRIMHFPSGPQRNDFDPFGNLLIVRGSLPNEQRNLENFAIPEPDRAAASILGGRMLEATSLPDRAPDLVLEGDSVGEMAAACLKPSDNYLAECLMLLGAAKEGDLGANPYSTGPARMRGFLTKVVGLTENEVRPMDGSGMSRHNLVTPRGIVKVLNWALRQPTSKLWQDALAHPGQPGTLSSRLQSSSFIGKTGSLNSVATLSGYVKSGSGEVLTVSILFNHFIVPASDVRAVADRIVREIEKPVTILSIPVRDGPVFEGTIQHESRCPLPSHSAADDHRFRRPLHDGLAARERANRGAQSSHAAAHRAERVAVRLR